VDGEAHVENGHGSAPVALLAKVPLCVGVEANVVQIVVGVCGPEVPSEWALRCWMNCLVAVLNDMKCEAT